MSDFYRPMKQASRVHLSIITKFFQILGWEGWGEEREGREKLHVNIFVKGDWRHFRDLYKNLTQETSCSSCEQYNNSLQEMTIISYYHLLVSYKIFF